jgi:DNA-binding CsgD family transcriptional regulator
MKQRRMHDEPTMFSPLLHLNPNRISDKCASCPARLEATELQSRLVALRESAETILSNLTTRQQQIMQLVIDGHPSKNIAADLGISQRTVENHRAAIMKRTGSHSIPALTQLVILMTATENAVIPQLLHQQWHCRAPSRGLLRKARKTN